MNIILILIIDLLLYYHYTVNFEKMKLELTISREETFLRSKQFLYFLLEVLICSVFIPPNVDRVFHGSIQQGTYMYSLNDIVCIISFLKTYNLVRLYYHLSRWTTREAEVLCIE